MPSDFLFKTRLNIYVLIDDWNLFYTFILLLFEWKLDTLLRISWEWWQIVITLHYSDTEIIYNLFYLSYSF